MDKKENTSLIAIVAIVAIVAITLLLLFAAKNRYREAEDTMQSACYSDADCGEGMRCVNAGDPYAYCKFIDMGPEDVRQPVVEQLIIDRNTYPPEMYQ